MANHQGKKLINSVDACVDDNLEGFVCTNPGARVLSGHRVVIRGDINDVIWAGKVTLICGGGSGHEPAHAGYVGKGMLSAVVAGSVFTSPPPGDILAAIRAVGKNNKVGTLMIVKNYTGDRLNFGLAAERAKSEGYKVDIVIVNEDCALTSVDKTAGRRGLCGTVLVHKLAGALAEEGRSLEEMVNILKSAVQRMGTIGLSLTPCSVPGSGPSFTLGKDEMELGLGIHGEAGVKRMKLSSAREAVQIMVDHMTNPANQTHLELTPGKPVACMVNNLGGTSVLEMNILTKETISYLESKKVVVCRAYCGTFMTSLEMAGFSITLLKLDDVLTKCLDASTSAPAWSKPFLPEGTTTRQTPPAMESEAIQAQAQDQSGGSKLTPELSTLMFNVLTHVCESLVSAEEELNSLDTQSGDGDCGTTLRRGAHAALDQLGSKDSPGLPLDNPSALCMSLANIAEEMMGGSSGALYSLFLTAAAGCLQRSCQMSACSEALSAGITAIKKYGGARRGDRTMLDALCPASDVLSFNVNSLEVWSLMAKAANEGAKSTCGMRAQAGRASYVSVDHLTQPDPGAKGVAIWLTAIAEAVSSNR